MYIKYSHLIPQVYLTVRKAQLKQHLMIDMSDGDQQCFSLIVALQMFKKLKKLETKTTKTSIVVSRLLYSQLEDVGQ